MLHNSMISINFALFRIVCLYNAFTSVEPGVKYHSKLLCASMLHILDRLHKSIWVLWGQDSVQRNLPEQEYIIRSMI